ncbi:MAG: hypothetical protein KKE49_04955, partial [Proteobacteria bacterium]|nr:hypothetical protein [Pseudomonadota bacterium]
MSHTAGIDIGSITAKAAILRDGAFLGTKVIFTGYNAEGAGRRHPRGDRLPGRGDGQPDRPRGARHDD